MAFLLLLRHGQTSTNAAAKSDPKNKIIVGPFDEPLSEEGEHESLGAGTVIRRIREDFMITVRGIVSSDAPRALRTKTLIIQNLEQEEELRCEEEPKFRERHPGDFLNQREDELRREHPDYFGEGPYASWPADYDISAPNGENYTELEARVLPAMHAWIQRMDLQGDEACIFCSHMHPTRVMLGFVLNLPRNLITRLPVDNATPYLVEMGTKNMLIGQETRIHQLIREHSSKNP